MRMDELERLAEELERDLSARELKIENFDLELALEKADTQELRNEVRNLIRRKAKQVYHDDEYAVFATTINYYDTYRRKKCEYSAVWVFGLDATQRSGFWIHRLQWRENFEELKEQDWKGLTKEKIKEWMGFAKQESEAWAAGIGEWVRLVGDLRMRMIETKEQHIERKISDAKESAEDEYLAENSERMNVNENEIREYQRERGWKVLSGKRRDEAISAVRDEKCRREFERNKDEILKRIEAEERSEIEKKYGGLGSFDMRVGNHVIKFERAERSGDWYAGGYEVAAVGMMVTIHGEHGTRRYLLPAGRYALALLPRHITQRR